MRSSTSGADFGVAFRTVDKDGNLRPALTSGNEFRDVELRSEVVSEKYVSHAYARGPVEAMARSFGVSITGAALYSSDALLVVMTEFFSAAHEGGYRQGMMADLGELIAQKEKKASPSEPFDTRFVTWERMANAVPAMTIECMVNRVERERNYFPTCRTKPKADKYSAKKLENKTWRAIQGADPVTLFQQQRWLAPLVEAAEACHEHIYLVNTYSRWWKYVGRLNKRQTAGADYSEWDSRMASNLMRDIALALCRYVGMPDDLAVYTANVVAHSWAVDQDGKVYAKWGGNSSGQYLTAVLNSLYHLVINLTCWSRVLGVNASEVYGIVDCLVTGDDELLTPPSPEALVEFCEVSETLFGTQLKVDLCCGELYPVGAHAPYLSRVSAKVNGHLMVLPSQPCRTLSAWQVPKRGADQEAEIYTAMMLNVAGYRVIRDFKLGWPIPVVVDEFLTAYDLASKGKNWPADHSAMELFALHGGHALD